MVIEDTETGVEKVGNKVNIRMATTKTLILAPGSVECDKEGTCNMSAVWDPKDALVEGDI